MLGHTIFLTLHLVLGAWIINKTVDNDLNSIKNVVILSSLAILSLVNYWLWMIPMNRNRNVKQTKIAKFICANLILIFAGGGCWVPSSQIW